MDSDDADLNCDFDDFANFNGPSFLPEQAPDSVVQQENGGEFIYNAVEDFIESQAQKSADASQKSNLQVLISVNINNDFSIYVNAWFFFHRFKLTD